MCSMNLLVLRALKISRSQTRSVYQTDKSTHVLHQCYSEVGFICFFNYFWMLFCEVVYLCYIYMNFQLFLRFSHDNLNNV